MNSLENIQILEHEIVIVKDLLDSPAKLVPLTGKTGLNKPLKNKNLYRPQLALAGFFNLFNHEQVQIFGNTEFSYLTSLTSNERIDRFTKICDYDLSCIVLTNNHKLDSDLIKIANKRKIPIFKSEYATTKASFLLTEFLDDQFAKQAVLHGSFVDVYGVGILFVGKSGIGKSEIALDLVERGHRLVADDIVMLTKTRETILMGTGTKMVQHFMEIRGLGIINVREMFGIRSIRFQKRLEIIVELQEWDDSEHYTRTGLDEEPANIMDVDLPSIKLPIFAGKNVTVIAEVIALNYLLKTYGYDAAEVMSDKLHNYLKKKNDMKAASGRKRAISYFQSDNE